MTIETRYGDMLRVQRGILVHGCNARGAMGAGIALAIKQRFPQAFRMYRDAYERTGLTLGTITSAEIAPDLIVVNAITQDDWRRPEDSVVLADYDAIENAFGHVRTLAIERGLAVHFPLIGCGLAGGSWDEVAPRIERALGPGIEKILWRLPEKTAGS
jgi:O-acetyl-ADP-ribose deacetylase (regulator of RNase III)